MLREIKNKEDIPKEYEGTPIERLLLYHNFNEPFATYDSAQLLIGMCMDNRKDLNLPPNFAYVLRTGGGNLRYNEFKISYAIAVGKVRYVALIGHNHCGMINLTHKKEDFIEGLVGIAGWDEEEALAHFMKHAPIFEIEDSEAFVLEETVRIGNKYKGVKVIPLFYKLEDNKLYIIE